MVSPPRSAHTGSRVVSSAANGLMVVVLTGWAMRRPLALDDLHVPRATLLFVAIMALAIRQLPRHHPFPQFGPANQVTTMRAALVCLVASLLGVEPSPLIAATAAGLATLVTALDGLDGWLARRSGMASVFGARFDMEVDALLILVLSLLAWHHGKAGSWVVLSGAWRYLFIAAGQLAAWMRHPLPPSRRRQMVCVVQVLALITIMVPMVEPPASVAVAAAALVLLTFSFALDTRWLWRNAAIR
jgi:phosphatidylglycerophosphate synthase